MAQPESVRAQKHITPATTRDDGGRREDAALLNLARKAFLRTGAAGVAIAIESAGVMRCVATVGSLVPPLNAMVDRNSGITGQCISSRIPMICANTQEDPRVDAAQCSRAGIGSIVVAPILTGVAVTGVIEAFAASPHAFQQSQLRDLTSIAEAVSARTAVQEKGKPALSARSGREPATVENSVAAQAGPASDQSTFSLATASVPESRRWAVIFGSLAIAVAGALFMILGPHLPHTSLKPTTTIATPSEPSAKGDGNVPVDLLRSGNAGDGDAQYQIAMLYLGSDRIQDDKQEGMSWLRRAAESGQRDAQYSLAAAFANGDGVSTDTTEAYTWYLVALLNGKTEATEAIKVLAPRVSRDAVPNVRSRIGEMYMTGGPLPKDPESAYMWLALAEEAGDRKASQRKAELEKTMIPEQVANAKTRVSEWLAQHQVKPPTRSPRR